MSAWATKDATETWQDVCDRAWAGEPQFVSRGSSQMVVVISYVDYQLGEMKRVGRMSRRTNRLLDVLRSCPCGDDLAVAIDDQGKSVPSYFERCGGFEEKA